MMKCKRLAVVIILMCVGTHAGAQNSEKIVIAAAADLKFALDSIITVFGKQDNRSVQVTYGSSGKLYEQLSHGAPFDIFFSADINYPKMLQQNGHTASEIYEYGIGRIVLWSKKVDVSQGMNALLSPGVKKISIANPAHAPYGKRAEEALNYFGLMTKVRDKLVFGENISQAAQFITSGAADIGIVALSLAVSPNMKKEGGTYYLIPEQSHQPLEQGMVITRYGGDKLLAVKFMDFVKSKTADDILIYYGFTKP